MNYITVFILFLLNFILQTTIFHFFEIFGVVPNTTLVLVIIFSFLYKEFYGIFYGILFGLIQDIFFGQIIGVAAFAYFTAGLIIYELKRYIYKDTLFTPAIITLFGVTYYHLVYWLFMTFFNANFEFFYMIKTIYLIEIFYDMAVAIFVYKLLINRFHSYGYYR